MAQMSEGKNVLERRLSGAGCARIRGLLDSPPRDECDAASGLIAGSTWMCCPICFCATIQMIMTLELWPLFIFSLLAGPAGMRSEPRRWRRWRMLGYGRSSSDPWYKDTVLTDSRESPG